MHGPEVRQGGAGATAADFPPTARSLELIARWCVTVLVAAPALAAVVLWVLLSGGDSGSDGPGGSQYVLALGVGLPVAAVVWLGYRRRMRAALRCGPWAACRATTVTSGVRSPTVVLQDPATGELRVYVARTALWLVDMADAGPGGVLWWRPGAKGGGVVSRPGGRGLVWVKPARSGRKREAGLAQAAQRGLVQPPPGTRQPAWGGPQLQQPAGGPPQGPPAWGPPQQDPAGRPPYPGGCPGPAPRPGSYPAPPPGPHPGPGGS